MSEDCKLAYGQEDIPAESLLFEIKYMEGLYLEFNFREQKWLLNCSYNANRNNIFNYVEKLQSLNLCTAYSDNAILIALLIITDNHGRFR